MEGDRRGAGPTQGMVIVVHTTCPDRATAGNLAGTLVAAGVAACAQVDGPIESTYRWQGAIERAEEWRCTIKTSPSSCSACLAAIRASHPYAVPELVWEVVPATPDYAAWVEEVTVRPVGEAPPGEAP